jgi:putative toxin-antitoxin system antitoxin component (TIGR02293 family)
VKFVAGRGAAAETQVRGGVLVISVRPPSLESFIRGELTPAAILRGAGLGVLTEGFASDVVEAGFPASVVRDFALASGMALSDVGTIVGTSDRTMSRKIATDERLGPSESDRAFRLFEITARAVRAFGDAEKGRRWIQRDVPSLSGRKPMDLLRTEIGTRAVLSAIDRIEFGGIT